MERSLRIIVDTKESFYPKAEYVFMTFCNFLKIKACVYKFETVDETETQYHDIFTVYYGNKVDTKYACTMHHNPIAADFYEEKRVYPNSDVVFQQFEDVKLPFLFSAPSFADVIDSERSKEVIRLCNHDIIASAFYFLSCWQEYVVEDNVKVGDRYDFKNSMQFYFGFTEIPIVDYYCRLFEKELERVLNLITPDKKPFVLSISHDIDYFEFWTKEHLFSVYKHNLKRFFSNPIKAIVKIIGHCITKQFFWTAKKSLNKILKKEEKFNCTSTAFLLTQSDKNDIRQEYFKNKDHRKQIKEIYLEKSVGLHGSMKSSSDIHLLCKQIDILKSYGFQIKGFRNHYLCFNYHSSFLLLEKAGIEYDATLGFWEQIGFRAGISIPFYPYNLKDNKPFNIIEIPLCVMDVTLFSHKTMNMSYKKAKKKIFNMIDRAKRHNTHISILWHNYIFDYIDYPLWAKLYWDIIKYTKKSNGWICSLDKLCEYCKDECIN